MKHTLEERDRSLALITRMSQEKDSYLYYANVKIVQMVEKLAVLQSPSDFPVSPTTSTPVVTSPPALAPSQPSASAPQATPKPAAAPARPPALSLSALPPLAPLEEDVPDSPIMPPLNKISQSVERRDSNLPGIRINKRRSAVYNREDVDRVDEFLITKTPLPRPDTKPVIVVEETHHNFRMWKQHPDIQTLMTTQTIPQNEIDRQEIIYEFIATETTYNRDLDLVVRRFIHPLKDLVGTAKFTESDFKNIFRNLEDIIVINENLLFDLQKRDKQQWPMVQSIGDIFLKHVSSPWHPLLPLNLC